MPHRSSVSVLRRLKKCLENPDLDRRISFDRLAPLAVLTCSLSDIDDIDVEMGHGRKRMVGTPGNRKPSRV